MPLPLLPSLVSFDVVAGMFNLILFHGKVFSSLLFTEYIACVCCCVYIPPLLGPKCKQTNAHTHTCTHSHTHTHAHAHTHTHSRLASYPGIFFYSSEKNNNFKLKFFVFFFATVDKASLRLAARALGPVFSLVSITGGLEWIHKLHFTVPYSFSRSQVLL